MRERFTKAQDADSVVVVSHHLRSLEQLEGAEWRYQRAASRGVEAEAFTCGVCSERWGWEDSLGTPLGPPRVEAFRCCDKEARHVVNTMI